MKRPYVPIFACTLCVAALVACETQPLPSPTAMPTAMPTAISLLPCPTASPGESVLQHDIRPPVPDYPRARNVQVATPVPPAYSLETPTVNSVSPRLTRRITRFTTSDSAQEIISFYRDHLAEAGWIALDEATNSNKISSGFSVESTVAAASRTNRCAPTPETDLPGYGVEVTTTGTGPNGSIVEVKEILVEGY